MVYRSKKTVPLARLALAAAVAVVFLVAEVSFADMIVGRASRSWGDVKVERDGSDIPFTDGMDLKKGDIIKTGRSSGAVFELLDPYGNPITEEELFGLPGPKGCADAEGERATGLIHIKMKPITPDKERIVIQVKKGTVKSKTTPGKEAESKMVEILLKEALLKKKGTDLAASYDLGSGQTSLSTLSGLVEFDNIVYSSLPDAYFTDPFNKCEDTLNLDFVLNLTSETVGVFDLLGAGNSVDVAGGYYSIAASPPSAPLPGKAPIHDAEGGLSPEPATMVLLAVGACLPLFRRKRR